MSKSYILGTTLNIKSIYEEAVDSVTIKILDPSNSILVDTTAMTMELDTVYSYKYQTLSTGTEGTCIVTITTTVDGYDSIKQEFFDVVRPAPFSAVNAS